METTEFCVTVDETTRVLTVNAEGTTMLQALKTKIEEKFLLLSDRYTLKVKVGRYGRFVDVYEEDEDDIALLRDGAEVLVSSKQEPSFILQMPLTPSTQTSDFEPLTITSSPLPTPPRPSLSTPAPSSPHQDQSFDVRAIVSAHPHGATINKEYDQNNTIASRTRILMCSIVCAELMKRFTNYPSREQKIMAAQKIIEAYPALRSHTDCPYDTWFDPNDSTKGHLTTKLYSMRRGLPKEHQSRPRKSGSVLPSRERGRGVVVQLKRKFAETERLTENEEEELLMLCKRSTVKGGHDVTEAMEKLYQNRREWIERESPCVGEIFKRYPRFRDMPSLIDLEFRLMFGEETSNKLVTTWETRYKHDKPAVMKMASITQTSYIQQLLNELKNPTTFDDTDGPFETTTEEESYYSFLLAIALLPSRNSLGKKKCSVADTMKFFIVYRPVGTNIEQFIKKGETNHKQPFLLCLGSREDPTQFFVIADMDAIPCGTDIVVAADKLFKIHYVCNLKYAEELAGFFCLLEHVFGLVAKGSKVSARTKELLSCVNFISQKKTSL